MTGEAQTPERRSLSVHQVMVLGKLVANQVNGRDGFDLIDSELQRADHEAVLLAMSEMLDPLDERVVPKDVDDSF